MPGLAAALYLVAAVGYAVEWSAVPAPLPADVAAVIFLLAGVATGVLARRWWSFAFALLVVPAVAALSRDGLTVFFAALFGVPAGAVSIALGALLARAARRRARGHFAVAATVAASLGGLPVVALAWQRLRPPVDRTPDRPLVVDTREGTFRGLRLGDSPADVRRRFGPARCSTTESITPLGEDFYDIGGPTAFGYRTAADDQQSAQDCVMRYESLAVFVSADGVHAFVTTDERAETSRGVGVGDSAEIVEERYRGGGCFIANEGTEYVRFPLCEAPVGPARRVFFGGDRIRSVWLIASSRRGLPR